MSAKQTPHPACPGTLVRPMPLALEDLPLISPCGHGRETWQEKDLLRLVGSRDDRPDLVEFIELVLLEGLYFISSDVDTAIVGSVPVRPSKSSSAGARDNVEKLKRLVSSDSLNHVDWQRSPCRSRRLVSLGKKEVWYGRRSKHRVLPIDADDESSGLAWDDFVNGLLIQHSEKQAEYVPGVLKCNIAADWHSAIADRQRDFQLRFQHVSMRVVDMYHDFTAGTPRKFSTLVVSGKVHRDHFINVQIPIDSHEKATDRSSQVRKDLQQRPNKTVQGQFASVESCQLDVDNGSVTWTMLSCSDAKGCFPLWLQRLAAPSMIAKNVEYFLDWVERGKLSAQDS